MEKREGGTDSGVTVLDAEGAGVVMGTLIEKLHAVSLGGEGGGQVDRYHLQHGISGRQPLSVHPERLHDHIHTMWVLFGAHQGNDHYHIHTGNSIWSPPTNAKHIR